MSKKKNVAVISEILETYEGRDKFLKALSYAAKLATLFTKSPETLRKFSHFGSKMSECRVILRLMDDIPIWQETISYGWGKQESDGHMRVLKLLRNAIDVVASPIEHICWMGEQKLVATNETFWDNISTRLWVTYLSLSLLMYATKEYSPIYLSLNGFLERIDQINSEIRHGSFSYPRAFDDGREKKILTLHAQWKNHMLTCVRLGLDLSYAISYLPLGILWGCRLKTWQVGLLGSLSSLIGIYQVYTKFDTRPVVSLSTGSSCDCTSASNCTCTCH